MSTIETLLHNIEVAKHGEDVRGSIHDAIERCYNDVHSPTLNTEALEAAIQTKIDEGEMAALTIGDGTITTAKIANGAITQAKLDPNISFEADAVLDETSTNAIQNKVVASAISELNGSLDTKPNTVNGISPDENGNITIGGIMDSDTIAMLIEVMSEGVYGTNQIGNIVALKHKMLGDTPTKITASLPERPLVGTLYSDLDFVVKATYSNGDKATVTGYSVSDGEVTSGTNIATVSYAGLSATASFTASTDTSYSIRYNLVGVDASDKSSAIKSGDSYTTTLSIEDDYEFTGCTVTMGGVDITSEAVSGLDILIQNVTGNIVITASASSLVYLDPLKPTRNGGYSGVTMYSDEFVTQITAHYNSVGVGVSEFPALNECEIRYTVVNNTDSDISLTGVGIGMIPAYNSEHTLLGIENARFDVAYWTKIDNSSHKLEPGASLTGTFVLKKGYQIAYTASYASYNTLTLLLNGAFVPDTFSGYQQLTDIATLPKLGAYRSISYYSDNKETLLRSSNGTPRIVSTELPAGTYDVEFRYVPMDIVATSANSEVMGYGMVSNATDTEAVYGFGSKSGKTALIPNCWFNGSLTVEASGMYFISSGNAIYGGDGSYIDIRIKEAS